MKKYLLLLMFLSPYTQADYYCNFTCIKINSHHSIVRGLVGGYQPNAVLAEKQTLVSGSGRTDFEAYQTAWANCKATGDNGQYLLVVTRSIVQQGQLIYDGRDAEPGNCKKARE